VNKVQPETIAPHGPSASAVEEALHVIAATREEDFDGHTEFYRLSPAERLAWMESVVCLIEARRSGNGAQ
jgi:hypothetical protein